MNSIDCYNEYNYQTSKPKISDMYRRLQQMYGSMWSLLYGLYDNDDNEQGYAAATKHDDEYDVKNNDDVPRLLNDVYDLLFIYVKG